MCVRGEREREREREREFLKLQSGILKLVVIFPKENNFVKEGDIGGITLANKCKSRFDGCTDCRDSVDFVRHIAFSRCDNVNHPAS